MSKKHSLRMSVVACALFVFMLAASAVVRPAVADTEEVGLTTVVVPNGSGTVNVNPPGPYTSGQSVTITAVPATGWVFDHWTVDGSGAVWWDTNWDYRLPVVVNVGSYARADKPVELAVNFTGLLTFLGQSGSLDLNSVRVIEVDSDDDVIDDNILYQFDPAPDFNAASKAAGMLTWLLEGNTAAGATRRYHVYFDVTGKSFTPPSFTPLVTATDDIIWNGYNSIGTVTPNSTYYFHKGGGGFATLFDANNNDWISWDNKCNPCGGGDNRGIPNMVHTNNKGFFHPGRALKTTTTLVSQGPLKVAFRSVSNDNEWETLWEIFPGYARMTVLKAPGISYWLMYEGTPGGALDMNSDFLTRPDGSSILASGTWTTDIPTEEWIYVSDPNVNRSIFLIHHQDDEFIDGYVNQNKLMTVFGFGRSGNERFLTGAGRQYTIGLVDSTVFDTVRPVVYNAYQPLTVATGIAEKSVGASLGKQNPAQFVLNDQHVVTAFFTPIQHTVAVAASPTDAGAVGVSPVKATYNYGEEVTLTATPITGFFFTGWQGDVTGTANPIKFTVTKNTTVTAQFAAGYLVSKDSFPSTGGTVDISPQLAVYPAGTLITATATPNPGYQFAGWSDGMSGTANPQQTTVNSTLNIVGNFTVIPYAFEITANGPGSVDWTPKKTSYTYGEVVRITATPDTDAVFDGWTGDLTGTTNPFDVVITGDTAITANFHSEAVTFILTTQVQGDGSIQVNPQKTEYDQGESVELTAVPGDGYVFAGWSGAVSGNANPTNVVMDANKTVIATFTEEEPITYTIGLPFIIR